MTHSSQLRRWSETKIQDAIAAGENIPITEEYIRAWYRLGLYQTQLGQWEDAKVSLDKARQLLSAQATPIDKSLHQGVEAATRDLALKCSGPSTDDTSGEQLIWYKALMILPLVECSQRPDTSVWTICHAQEAFERGFALTRKIRHGDDGKLTGELTAIAQLTNALVTERRVVQWHINHELSRQIKDQVNFEVSSLQGWPSIRDTNTVIEQARFRIRATGWASVRPMLDISVRSAILIGCLQCGLAGDQSSPARKLRSVGIAVLEDALRLLLQGQSAWKSVPINDKGHIFQDLFVRGVRRLVIDALQDFCGIDGKADPEILPALHNLRKEAIVQVSDVEAHHVDSLNPWARTPHTINGFWTYPLAEALCAQGLYHLWIAQFPGEGGPISSGPTPSDTPNPATPASKRAHEEFHLRNAARFFFDGGYKFPSDDEKHVYNLALGIISQCDAGTNLPQILPIINRIRSTVELMTGIWKSSTLTRERRRNQLLTLVLCLPELIKTKIERAEMQPLSQFRCCLNENGSWQFH